MLGSASPDPLNSAIVSLRMGRSGYNVECDC